MGFGALRNIVRPLARTLISGASTSNSTLLTAKAPFLRPECRFGLCPPLAQASRNFSFFSETGYDRLTDKRLPKRRPLDKPRRKRAGLRPAGAFAWVKYDAGEPIKPSNPNEGSVKRRNEKKRRMLHRAFVKTEAKKRKALVQAAKRKKMAARVDRKMASVARDRAWAERLAELQRLEQEKKSSMS
ncbi:unnamed protein product [Linum tenue]|uniref:Uncharacterized protein n=1 Tax=Linum tenue TaxID=586396 RepID=A0AAV0I4A5_9ROSI|nr:unnamed protein product [Linum tenue]